MKGIILGAGKGKRLNSEKVDIPKVLRRINDRPMISYVIDNLRFCDELIIVVGYKKEQVIEETNNEFTYAIQEEQLGTGHAVLACENALKDYNGPVIITFGDMPLIKKQTFMDMIKIHEKEKSQCTFLTCVFPEGIELPHYGRIIRDDLSNFLRVTEHRDCSAEELKINELNAGVMICDNQKMFACLKEIKNENEQREYYLTDLPGLMMKKGYKLFAHKIYDVDEIYGVNTTEDLKYIEELMKKQSEE